MAYSKSSPSPDEVPVLRACLPSMLSIVEYLCSKDIPVSIYMARVGSLGQPTSKVQERSCNKAMMDPKSLSECSRSQLKYKERTGPIRSGMNISRQMTLARMKKKPRRVTMLGASHMGNSSTTPFHWMMILISDRAPCETTQILRSA